MKCTWIMVAASLAVSGALLCEGCSKKTESNRTADDEPAALPSSPTPRPATASPARARRTATAASAPVRSATSTSPAQTAPSTATAPAPGVVLPAPVQEPLSPEGAKMLERFGAQVTSVTIRGTAIEVRITVPAADKAGPVLSPAAQRYLIDQKSGRQLLVPGAGRPAGRERYRSGAVRPVVGSPAAQRSYTIMFDNSAGLVRPGDKVALVIDEFRVDDLTVRE